MSLLDGENSSTVDSCLKVEHFKRKDFSVEKDAGTQGRI